MEVELGFEVAEGAPEGAEVEAARSLTRWLLAEPELRGVEVRPRSADPAGGQMGEVLEVVNVVLANGIALGSLVTAIATWRDSRRGGTRVRIERGGTSVVIEGGSAEEVRRIVAELEPPAGGAERS
ncbi:hypothetical protein [Kitasatospora sp. SUK 42]|uniref:effector-associated constant component EACC1 n=1 Tax=Kitasatospora sp. SUK 42 TaxID=1588882 RepID=UPI0018C91F02|nr:hypothetical protein [Kitasatospora sp. SUK 42]MBV2152204.1 hypothetical protein [Kitasatospora sp. SUK 42]